MRARETRAFPALREHLDNFLHRISKFIYFLTRIIEGKARASGRGYVEELHHGLRAVVAGADCNSLLVEDRTNIVRVHAFDRE